VDDHEDDDEYDFDENRSWRRAARRRMRAIVPPWTRGDFREMADRNLREPTPDPLLVQVRGTSFQEKIR